MRVLNTQRDFIAGKGPVPYIDNHDHSTVVNRVGGRGCGESPAPRHRLADFSRRRAPAQRPGVRRGLLRSGKCSDRVISRPLHWNFRDDDTGKRLFDLHRKLIALRKESPALRSANFYPSDYDEQWTHFTTRLRRRRR